MSASSGDQSVPFSIINAINTTTGDFRFESLPSNLTFINGTLNNGTFVNGRIYNGSAINGTTVIERLSLTAVGSVPLASFIYIIMSVVIILMLLPSAIKWIQAASGENHRYMPFVATSTFPEKVFRSQLLRSYPPVPHTKPLDSYAEEVNRTPSGLVTAEKLRKFRELLRRKYSLDCEIVNLRYVYEANRHIVEGMKKRSDGAVYDLQRMVKDWVQAKEQWSEDERALVEKIDKRISSIQPKYATEE